MTTKRARSCLKMVTLVAVVVGISGCGTAVKEKSAPCKRPANLTSYAEDIRRECGPMTSVNGDPVAAMAAINMIAAQ